MKHHSVTHGHSIGGPSPTYLVWQAMRQRCENANCASYAHYGARGIRVCREWASFERFLADMGERPEGTSIDRKDNALGYSKANCRWATPREQSQNQRTNRNITFNGETHCMDEWARRLGMKPITLAKRFVRGWSVAAAFTTPVRRWGT